MLSFFREALLPSERHIVAPKKTRDLHTACRRGLVSKLKQALDAGVEINHPDDDSFTPLMITALNNYTACAQLLLERGASTDATNQSGSTALMLACSNGREAAAKLLIEHGANVNVVDADGNTALKEAAVAQSLGMMEQDDSTDNQHEVLEGFRQVGVEGWAKARVRSRSSWQP